MSPGTPEFEATTRLLAGGGPARMIFGLLLARAGVNVSTFVTPAEGRDQLLSKGRGVVDGHRADEPGSR